MVLAEQAADDEGIGRRHVARLDEHLVLAIDPRPQQRPPRPLGLVGQVGIGADLGEEGGGRHGRGSGGGRRSLAGEGGFGEGGGECWRRAGRRDAGAAGARRHRADRGGEI